MMRTTDEQMQEIMKRAEDIRMRKILKKRMYSYMLAACACVVLLITVLNYVPKLETRTGDVATQRYGSLLLDSPYMGYVVIGLIALVLGICSTLLCINWRELRQREQESE